MATPKYVRIGIREVKNGYLVDADNDRLNFDSKEEDEIFCVTAEDVNETVYDLLTKKREDDHVSE